MRTFGEILVDAEKFTVGPISENAGAEEVLAFCIRGLLKTVRELQVELRELKDNLSLDAFKKE